MGLCCCSWAFSSCGEQGLLSSCGALASYCGGFSWGRAWALGFEGFCSCGTRAYLCSSMWDLPGPGIEPVSPALAGRFLPAESSGKSCFSFYCHQFLGFLVVWGKVWSRMDTERERDSFLPDCRSDGNLSHSESLQLYCAWQQERILVTCRLWLSRSGAGSEILNFSPVARGGCSWCSASHSWLNKALVSIMDTQVYFLNPAIFTLGEVMG